MALLQPPLLPVEAVVCHVLLHDLVAGVEQHVTGRARSRLLDVVHCHHVVHDDQHLVFSQSLARFDHRGQHFKTHVIKDAYSLDLDIFAGSIIQNYNYTITIYYYYYYYYYYY